MIRRLCIAIHDVSPATWPHCEKLLRMIDSFGRLPMTLAVVPDFHGSGRIDRAPWFKRIIDEYIEAGAEVALHGYRHWDEAPEPATMREKIQRRMLTASEGEFAALSTPEARLRIQRGQALFKDCGWQASGFIPPAWLAGEGTLKALRQSSIIYMSWRMTLQRLFDGAVIDAPCITVSARSAWRRVASKLWLTAIESA